MAMETRTVTGKSFNARGPATETPRLCIDDNRRVVHWSLFLDPTRPDPAKR